MQSASTRTKLQLQGGRHHFQAGCQVARAIEKKAVPMKADRMVRHTILLTCALLTTGTALPAQNEVAETTERGQSKPARGIKVS